MIDGYLQSTRQGLVFDYLMPSNELAQAIDSWVVLTDGIVDHEIKPEAAMRAAEWGLRVVDLCAGNLELWRRISEPLTLLYLGGKADLEYVPGKMDKEADLALWGLKANRLSVQYALVCHEHPKLSTKDEWAWVKETQETMLKLNDCVDILNECYEDLIQVRRNWVLLNHFDSTVFTGWKDKVVDIRKAAIFELEGLKVSEPCNELSIAEALFSGALMEAQRRYL